MRKEKERKRIKKRAEVNGKSVEKTKDTYNFYNL